MAAVLSRRGAEALVSARLAALGHDADFITPDALEALRRRAGHEEGTFGAALGAVLFLASTEDALRIESRHVEQAVPLNEAPAPAAWVTWRAWHMIAAGVCAAAVLALWLLDRPIPALDEIRSPRIATDKN